VGEQSGQLSNACQQAHDYLKKMQSNQKNWRKALAQPILNLCFFIGALVSFSQGLLPTLATADAATHDQLPWATRFLLAITHWEPFYFVYVMIVGMVLFWLCLRPLKIPLIGPWIARKHYWSIFSGLVLLLKVNIPLLKALTIIEQSLEPRCVVHGHITKMLRDIQEGQTLAQSGEKLPYFSTMYLQFLKAGESTGQLLHSLELLANFIQDDLKRLLDRWLFWINPISLVLIGACFWILIEATIYPLYSEIEGNVIGSLL
jgi:type II secretory pathway component PulF